MKNLPRYGRFQWEGKLEVYTTVMGAGRMGAGRIDQSIVTFSLHSSKTTE